MTRPRPSLLLAALLGLATTLSAQMHPGDAGRPELATPKPPDLVRHGVSLDVPRLIDARLHFLASDEMGGRDTGTPQGDITARYIASAMEEAGLEPAGDDGGYLQRYPLVRTSLDVENLVCAVVDAQGTRTTWTPGEDVAVRGYGSDGWGLEAGLVFAGHGLVDEASGLDEYGDLDVTGRIVVVLWGAPEGHEDLAAASNWRAKLDAATERGAAGLLYVLDPEQRGARQTFRWVSSGMNRGSLELGGDLLEQDEAFPRLYVQPEAAGQLFAAAGLDLAQVEADGLGARPLPGVTLSTHASVTVEQLSAANAAGLLPGHDPELAEQVVVVSAHMDHIGTNDAGEVYNGADDNASGTTTVLTVADVLAGGPPLRRSVLFLSVSGEEKGLLGSEWWVHHPTLPIERLVGDVNIDMVGRNAPYEIGITPSPDHEMYNSIVDRAVDLGPASGLAVGFYAGEGDYRHKVDDYYHRSDHANFADAGVPVAFLFSGEHEDYHQPTDTVDKIDQGKVWRVVDLVEHLVSDLADADDPPHRTPPTSH